jgi:hypothetical protein
MAEPPVIASERVDTAVAVVMEVPVQATASNQTLEAPGTPERVTEPALNLPLEKTAEPILLTAVHPVVLNPLFMEMATGVLLPTGKTI